MLSNHKTDKNVQKALECGYYVRLYYIGLNSKEESIKRIENRVAKGGHNFTTEYVIKRYNTRYKDISAVLPYCNEGMFYDYENGFQFVAEYLSGELTIVGDDPPQRILELKEYLK